MNKPLPPHGTTRRYGRGCHCTPCVRARSAGVKRARYLRDTGRPLTVPVTAALRHVEALRAAGMPDRAIVAAAGICGDTLYGLTGGQRSIQRATQDRILAVTPPREFARTMRCTDSTGTRRRLRALITAGWPRSAIAREMGVHKPWVQYLVKNERPVTTWTAYRVQVAYEALSARRPEGDGLQAGRIAAARAEGQAAGWPDPTWWEDWGGIDNPQAPETEPTVKRGAYAEARYRAEEIRHLASCGLSFDEIAARLSTPSQRVTAKYVKDVATGTRAPGWRQQQREAAA